MRTTPIQMPYCTCPSCGGRIDAATAAVSPDDGSTPTPEPGDITFCIYCAEILLFKEDMTVRTATKADLEPLDIPTQMRLLLIQETVRSMAAKRLQRPEGGHAN